MDAPTPIKRAYRLLVLENEYLRLTLLPEIGGRIWQVIHKPSDGAMFYQNSVVKPSPWGPGRQLGWLALGGMEWNLPVSEHGYDWGTSWEVTPLRHSDQLVSITVSLPKDGRALEANITISLRAGEASFEVAPAIVNRSGRTLAFDYWHTAMLAPGTGNRPSEQLHFILPNSMMTVHSTGDPAMPEPAGQFTWPVYNGRDLSLLGHWEQYLGFFEYPAAHGPFVGVYDRGGDAGAVRVYPADTARGSKVFGLGWRSALNSDNFTDDGSAYVELHGGLAPTFFEQVSLAAGGSAAWRETWYPVWGIGDLTFANEWAALYADWASEGVRVGLYPTRLWTGDLVMLVNGREVARQPVRAGPDAPFNDTLMAGQIFNGKVAIRLEDAAGHPLLTYEMAGN
jgi:hypothetical protein